MQVERITEHSIITPQGEEIVLFLLQPTNVSVLSRESLRARVNALMHVLKGFVEVELLCLNSRESFEHNKQYLTGRMEQEESAPIRTLLEQDLRHLDEIQSRTATAREFMLIIRPRNIGEREMYPYLSRLEKMIREQGFTVRRAGYEDIKRILAVYFSQDVISEGYDDFDGQKWLLKNGQSDYKAASVMEEAEVLQTFLDLIAPAAIRFEVDRYMVGNTFRCVWAVRGYPTSTEEQALLQRLGERAGVTLHIYTRLVSPAEERKILQAADKANRFKGSSTDIREMVEAQSNLEDVSSMIRTAHRNREPFFHTAVYIELIARTEQEFSELRDSVEAELGRGKISVDRLHLCQQDGFLSVMPSGHNAFGEEFERMLPASSVANLFPFAYTGKTDPNGFYVGYDKYGSSIIVDLERRAADKSNANTLILGNSGKGKSYFLKLLLCNILESGKKVICLDPENEYEEITRRLGGAYLDLTSGRNLINVLEPRMWSHWDDQAEGDVPAAFRGGTLLSQHISFLRDFFRSYKPFDDGQIDTIEIMLGRLYSKWGLKDNTDFSLLGPTDYPTLSDLYDLMDAEYQRIKAEGTKEELYTPELLRSALLGLHSLCKGADSKFFNGHTSVDASCFVTFGVKDLMESGKNIKDAMLFNVLSYISHALISGGNTAGVFEELHVFLSNPVAVSYIRNAMKRVRKRGSMIVLSSQNIEDFLLPGVAEMTKPLFSIPTHHFLFHPGTIDKRAYMDALQLEETEYKLILDCQTGCCLYKCGAERYNLVVKTPEHKLALYGAGGGVPPLSRPTRPSALHLSRHPSGCLETKAVL